MFKEFMLKNLKAALKFLAQLTLLRNRPLVIGITGNVGKTSAKEAIFAVLKSSKKRVRAPSRNFNNEFGLPLAILGNWKGTGGSFFWLKVFLISIFRLIVNWRYPQILVLEYGIDRPGDMKYLLDVARPEIGVMTAIGTIPVHVEFFAGPGGVLAEKAKLVSQLPATGFAVLNADDESVLSVKHKTRARIITFGFYEKADMQVSHFNFNFKDRTLNFKLTYGGSFVPVKIKDVVGKGPVYAAAAAAVLGTICGMNLVEISKALQDFEAPKGRMRVLPGIKNTNLIDDTYNSSPLALREALETIAQIKAKRKIGVFGDMLEIGRYTFEAHSEIGEIAAKILDMLFAVGMRAKFIAEAAIKAGMSPKKVFTFDNVNEAGKFLEAQMKEGDLVLLKASQAVRLEKVVKEVMAEPERAAELLVRQEKTWLKKLGLYDSHKF